MKKLILGTLAIAGLTLSGYSQGVITADGSLGGGESISAVLNTTQDVNAELLYLSGVNYLPVVTFLVSDLSGDTGANVAWGATEPAAGDITFNSDGTFYDANGNLYQNMSMAVGTVVTFKFAAWTGPDSNYAAAAADLSGKYAISAAFTEALSDPLSPILASLNNVPALNLVTPSPEPATFAMMGLGGLSLLLFRRRK